VEGAELVQSRFPEAEHLTVPEAGHLLMVQNPTALADGLIDFFSRHPMSDDAAAAK
jgi:pimeloyl-ACP methyl ester carboxylesterase